MVRPRLGALMSVIVGALLTLGSLPAPAHAQHTRLLFDDGGLFGDPEMATIQLTGPSARVPPDTAAARTDEHLHVLYQPDGDWAFTDDATKTARQIRLLQDGVSVAPAEVALQQAGGSIVSVRAGYPRGEIDWFAPVAFGHAIDTSATLSLPEVYAAEYPRLREPYDRGRRLINERKPYRALDTLAVFYGDVTPAFSFIPKAKATLDSAAAAAVELEADTFQGIRQQVVSSPTVEALGRLRAFAAELDSTRSALAFYFKKRPEGSAPIREHLDTLESAAATLYDNAYESYRRQSVRLFFQEPYTQPKTALFIDVLTRLLLVPDPALAASEARLDGFPRQALGTPRFADARERLQSNGWQADFEDVLTVVENNLRKHERLFGEEVMRSLRVQRISAVQPYYEILAALNALARGDRGAFEENWTRALAVCTDLELLSVMQHWTVARRSASSRVSDRSVSLMNEVERLQNEGQTHAARRRLVEAGDLLSEYPPLIYERGRLELAEGDTTAAQADFERARTLDSDYTAPRVASLRLLLDQGQYKKALRRADATLQAEPYWLVYFAKARALVALGRSEEAIEALRGRCEQLNDQSYALYVLLAELYVGREAWDGVVWAVQQAEKRTPQRPAFEQRLQDVRDTVRATEAASLQQPGADPGTNVGQ